jgi:hypothetical protein
MVYSALVGGAHEESICGAGSVSLLSPCRFCSRHLRTSKEGNRAEQVATAIRTEASVEDLDGDGKSPLRIASQDNQNPEVISVLLDVGANGKLASKNEKPPSNMPRRVRN